nr:hypothetical protein [Kibdelosporangium sp. MJ126-NF4]CEL17662.1 hypothetical protein [Kibdelosporangium sp. MJ126-NF4]CTQ91111.1 hypothetical protein [Kibdelosporangium sp. MJ126-NF4]
MIKIVTTYSMPGDRVLLLVPPAPRRPGFYSGLEEAAWPVVRLGRSVQAATVGPPGDQWQSADRSTSELRPADAKPQATRTPDGPFDVIITAAEPDTLARVRVTTWGHLLTPTGILAIVTHSDQAGPRLYDPTGALVRAAQHDGLRYLDHIALLQVPVKHSALDDPHATLTLAANTARGSRVHADLHVFGRGAPVPDGQVNQGDMG